MQTYYGPSNGNHPADAALFFKVDKFIRFLTDREAQKQALYLMDKHGMGEDRPVTDEELDEYLDLGE